jgi:hypothetical protein
MENITVIRDKFQETVNLYDSSFGSTSAYYEGKIVGMIEGVAAMLSITWIEAEIMLRKSE